MTSDIRNLAIRKFDLMVLRLASPNAVTHGEAIEDACDDYLHGASYTDLRPRAWRTKSGMPSGVARACVGRRSKPDDYVQTKIPLRIFQKLDLVAHLLMRRYPQPGKVRCSYAVAIAWLARDCFLPLI